MSGRALITCRQMQDCIHLFREQFEERDIEVVMPNVVQQLSEDQLVSLVRDVDGIIAGDDPLTDRVMTHAPRLRVISKWGVGTDAIDRQAARTRGIVVTNTPQAFGDEVADVALGYVICLARQLHRIHSSVREGQWLKVRGSTLAGKTLGIVGFGDIGRNVGRRARAFGMTVLAQDVTDEALEAARAMGGTVVQLDELLRRSHFVILCCPLTPETRHLLDAARLALLPRGAYVVNVSRGPLIDEPALVDALRTGHVAAAGLDVFEVEPLPRSSHLHQFEQCIFGSHNGSNTHEGVVRASERAVANLFRELES